MHASSIVWERTRTTIFSKLIRTHELYLLLTSIALFVLYDAACATHDPVKLRREEMHDMVGGPCSDVKPSSLEVLGSLMRVSICINSKCMNRLNRRPR